MQTKKCINVTCHTHGALNPLVLLLTLMLGCTPQTSSVIAECLQLNTMLHGAKMLFFKSKALPYQEIVKYPALF